MTERYSGQDIPVTTGAGVVRTTPLRDRFHWPSIVGGAFIALALLVISAILSRAVTLDYTFTTVQSTGREAGIIAWGAVAALICFGIGAYFAARMSSAYTEGSGVLNGFMVWAVVVPLIVYFLGASQGPMLGKTPAFRAGEGAIQASAQFSGPNATANNAGNADRLAPTGVSLPPPNTYGHTTAAAWWMILSLGCGLIASLVCGYWGINKRDRGMSAKTTMPPGSAAT